MNRDEILAKSRAEHKNADIYEQEVLKRANTCVIWVLGALATLFFIVQILAGGGLNFGIYAMVLSVRMTTAWVKTVQLKQKEELPYAIAFTVVVLALSVCHIYNQIT